jgi:hypothetical protein
MAKVFAEIEPEMAAWIAKQHLFFVATAPAGDEGLVNCSPKGLNTFAILDPLTVAYLDLTGSGVETIAHLRENGRIVVMFCALEGAAKIVRLHGEGEVITPDDPGFAALYGHFAPMPGVRAVIKIRVMRVSDSCGFGVPEYAYVGERRALVDWAETKGESYMAAYQAKQNAQSLDGLPALAPRISA